MKECNATIQFPADGLAGDEETNTTFRCQQKAGHKGNHRCNGGADWTLTWREGVR